MTFIIANTLQLTIPHRREEIEIMHLVGASPAFIQVPFYVEGIIQGLLGAGLAMLSSFSLHKIFLSSIAPSVKEWMVGIPILFLPPKTIVIVSIRRNGSRLFWQLRRFDENFEIQWLSLR